MKIYIIFFCIFFFAVSVILAKDTYAEISKDEKNKIAKAANGFLKAVKEKNKTDASAFLYKNNIINLTDGEKKQLIYSFSKGETSEIEYRTKMTSHYTSMFAEKKGLCSLVSYKIDTNFYTGFIQSGIEKKITYYYLYADSKYDMKYETENETNMVPVTRKIRIEFIKVENDYKVIGFSI